jgi:ABC-type multidrug transport system fused ATPase/permease subunit
MLINFLFLSKFRHHQNLEQINKDETMKMIIKTLNDIENIKLNAEEIDYIKKIYQNKNQEMACYSNKCLVNNINSAILWFVPIAMTIMTIFVFQNLDTENINVENIFTLLNILIQINGPIRDIPGTFRIIYETWVSVKRIENYLNSKDQNEGVTYYEKNNIDLINKRIMIKIENGYFTWGKQKKEANNKIKNKKEKNNKKIIIEENTNKKEEEEEEKIDLIKDESLIPIDEKLNSSDEINKNSSNQSNLRIDSEEKINLYDFIMLELPLEDPETTNNKQQTTNNKQSYDRS